MDNLTYADAETREAVNTIGHGTGQGDLIDFGRGVDEKGMLMKTGRWPLKGANRSRGGVVVEFTDVEFLLRCWTLRLEGGLSVVIRGVHRFYSLPS